MQDPQGALPTYTLALLMCHRAGTHTWRAPAVPGPVLPGELRGENRLVRTRPTWQSLCWALPAGTALGGQRQALGSSLSLWQLGVAAKLNPGSGAHCLAP